MMANMAASLIVHKKITTTTAKAKALRVYVEPLITKSKSDSTHSRRVVFSYLQDKEAVSELFREVSPKIIERPGGYTRILKTGSRPGDSADMCIIELVDFNENLLKVKEDAAKASRRRRRGGKKKGEQDTEVAVADTAVETASEEKPVAAAEADTEKQAAGKGKKSQKEDEEPKAEASEDKKEE